MDLRGRRPLVNANLEQLPFRDGSFDVIYCSHVLEHVASDRAAMRELRRVLAPGGWAILQVPIIRETTYEDASITSETGRLAAFGSTTTSARTDATIPSGWPRLVFRSRRMTTCARFRSVVGHALGSGTPIPYSCVVESAGAR